MSVVVFDRKKSSGNIYYVLGQACTVLNQEGREEEAKKMCNMVYASESYESALSIIS